MAILRYGIFGMRYGNFAPASKSRDQLKEQVKDVRKFCAGCQRVFAPIAEFTSNIENADGYFDSWFARTITRCDGGATAVAGTGIAFFNADCPVVCLYQDNNLAVLHAGYRCLIEASPSYTRTGIIGAGVNRFKKPKEVRAFIFGGIGPCCWLPEYEDKPEIKHPSLSRYPDLLRHCSGTTTRHPSSKNAATIDLYQLAKGLLIQSGVPKENIGWDTNCTCCATNQDGSPKFWSHNRFKAGLQETDGRNMSIAWLATD